MHNRMHGLNDHTICNRTNNANRRLEDNQPCKKIKQTAVQELTYVLGHTTSQCTTSLTATRLTKRKRYFWIERKHCSGYSGRNTKQCCTVSVLMVQKVRVARHKSSQSNEELPHTQLDLKQVQLKECCMNHSIVVSYYGWKYAC